jgi:TRAP-type C4-dicarboxylate transport system substrate-binding protein
MNHRVRRLISAISMVLVCTVLIEPRYGWSAAFNEKVVRDCVKESVKLLMRGEQPVEEQRKRIQEISAMIDGGVVSKEEIQKIVKAQVFAGMEEHKLSRYEIGNMLNRASKLLPSVAGDELHQMLWEKVQETLREPITLKMGTLAPDGTSWVDFPRKKINPHLKRLSGGKLNMKLYVGGVMGEDGDILRKMDLDQLDACGCSALGIYKAAPEMGVLSLPRLFRNYEEVYHISEKFVKEIDDAFEKRGYSSDVLVHGGFLYLWSKNNILSLDDARKQRILTWFGTVETATCEELGIHPTPVAVPEAVAAYNTGLINGSFSPAPWILGAQAYNNVNYYISQPFFYMPGSFVSSNTLWDRFKNKYSDVFTHNFNELRIFEIRSMEKQWRTELKDYEKKCFDAFETRIGIKPVALPDRDMSEIDAAAERVWEKLTGKLYSRDLLDRIIKELENYRKK